MNLQELSKYNGRNGQPAYVAVKGTIYDVSSSPFWLEGNHLNAHQAGTDLTQELKSAPHVRTVIERFPSVGSLDNQNVQEGRKRSRLPLIVMIITALVILMLTATFML